MTINSRIIRFFSARNKSELFGSGLMLVRHILRIELHLLCNFGYYFRFWLWLCLTVTPYTAHRFNFIIIIQSEAPGYVSTTLPKNIFTYLSRIEPRVLHDAATHTPTYGGIKSPSPTKSIVKHHRSCNKSVCEFEPCLYIIYTSTLVTIR